MCACKSAVFAIQIVYQCVLSHYSHTCTMENKFEHVGFKQSSSLFLVGVEDSMSLFVSIDTCEYGACVCICMCVCVWKCEI